MINQTTYEHFGLFLVDAMDEAQVRLVKASDKLLLGMAKNPDKLLTLQAKLESSATQAASLFGKSSKAWAENELPKAYIAGIKHTEDAVSTLGVPFGAPKTGDAVLEHALTPHASLKAGVKIGGGVPKGMQAYPAHLSILNVFQHTAAEAGAQASFRLIRGADDVARQAAVLAGSKLFQESSEFTRRALSRSMLQTIAKDGIGFVQYANGRRMPLDSYVEMVGRTMTGRAAVTGSLARYKEMGYDLVLVSAHFRTCQLCQPWEGKVLSQGGGDEKYPALQLAIDQGLFHPNCAHNISPYFPKLTRTKLRPLRVPKHPVEKKLYAELGRDKAVAHTFNAQQRQRHIERRIRHFKRRAAAGGPEGAKAQAKVNAWRSKMRLHLKEHPYLPRKRFREAVTGLPGGTLAPGPLAPVVGPIKPAAMSPVAAPKPLTQPQKLVASLEKEQGLYFPPFKQAKGVVPDIDLAKAVEAGFVKKKWFPLADARVYKIPFGPTSAKQLEDALQKALEAQAKFKVDSAKIRAVKFQGKYVVTSGKVEVTVAKLLGKKFATAGEVIDLDAFLKVQKAQKVKPLKPKPKPSVKPKPVVKPASKPIVSDAPAIKGKKVDRIQLGDPGTQEVGHWKQVGPQKGSNPGGLFESPTGEKWYIKTPSNPEQAWNEAMASKLYQHAGVNASRAEVVLKDGKISLASKFDDAAKAAKAKLTSEPHKIAGVFDDFAADAWLANWDVVGLQYDNLLVSGGRAFRLDAGGSLRFRAQGSLKGTAFGPKVTELDSLRGLVAGVANPASSSVFGSMTTEQVIASAQRLVSKVDKATVRRVAKAYSPTKEVAQQMESVLIARLDDVKNQIKSLKQRVKDEAKAAQVAKKARERAAAAAKKEAKNLAAPVRAFEAEVDEWAAKFEDLLPKTASRPQMQGKAFSQLPKAMERAKKELEKKYPWLADREDAFLTRLTDATIRAWSGSAKSTLATALKISLREAWGETLSAALLKKKKTLLRMLAGNTDIPTEDFWKFFGDVAKARSGYTRAYLKGAAPNGLNLYRAHGLSDAATSEGWLRALATGGNRMYVPNGASGFSDKVLSFGAGDGHVVWKVRAKPNNVWASWWENKKQGRWSYGNAEKEYIVQGNTMVDVLPGTKLVLSDLKKGSKSIFGGPVRYRNGVPIMSREKVLERLKASGYADDVKTLLNAGWEVELRGFKLTLNLLEEAA